MDFPPIVPYKVPTSSDRLHNIKEDVIVYDGGIKNVHQDFVVVFAITFAVIVLLIVILVTLFHTIKKCKSFIQSRKSVPNVYVATEEGENTIVYEKEVSQIPQDDARRVVEETKFLQEMEVRETEKPKQSSRERRKMFAEGRSRTAVSGCEEREEVGSGGARQGRRHTHTCSLQHNIEMSQQPRKQYSAQY